MLRNAGALVRAWLMLACVASGLNLTTASAQTGVSSSGTATHSHPIAVPPGIGGMQPNLSLLFSGGGVNGPVGHGWSVQGISMITRCAATRFIDGQPRGVMFDGADKLCMDGQRLVQTDASGNPLPMPQSSDATGLTGDGWREYRTERDSYARIRAYGASLNDVANGPQYFKVWTKAGQIYEYGSPPFGADGNTRATVLVQGRNTVMVWAVARVSDVVGNFINFKYEQRDFNWGSGPTAGAPTVGREWNIAEIQYTGNGSTPPANKVIFRYTDRTDDRAEAYQRGAKNISIRRLDAIDSYVNSPNASDLGPGAGAVAVRRIRLNYDLSPTTKRSRVVSIKECADIAETRCQPPTRFNYAPGAGEALVETGLWLGATGGTPFMKRDGTMGTIPVDLNGDGRTDLLRWGFDASQNQAYLSGFGEGSDFSKANAFNLVGEPLFSQDHCYASMIADFNGDGIPDILRHVTSKVGTTVCSTARPTTLYLGNGDGGFTAKSVTGVALDRTDIGFTCNGAPPNACVWQAANNFYVLDVDGDGRADIVTAYMPAKAYQAPPPTCPTGTACTRVFKGNGQGGFTEMPSNLASQVIYTLPWENSSVGEPNHVSDVDGDGLSDLSAMGHVLFATTTTAWRSRGDGNFDPIGAPALCKTPIDFNGDGRADCLEAGATVSSPNALRVSDGTSTLKTVASFNLTAASELSGFGVGFSVLDVNGDGRDDILRWKNDPTQNRLYLSNGDGSFRVSTTFNLTSSNHSLRTNDGTTDFLLGNFDGSGRLQILRIKDNPIPGSSTGNTLYTNTGPQADLLLSVISPTGQKTELTYQSLAEKVLGGVFANAALYASDRGTAAAATWPMMDTTPATPVVTTIAGDVIPGRVAQNTTAYFYRGMKVAVDGRGPLGFRQMGQEQLGPNGQKLLLWTDYRLDEPYSGVASRTETRNAADSRLLSQTINSYCDRTSGTNPDLATETSPCTSSSPVRRPYVRRSVASGWDLDGTPLPVVTTVNTYNDQGDPTRIDVTTTGTVAGFPNQVSSKSTENTYCVPDTAGCPNKITGDNWILGRLTRAKVTNSVPKLVDAMGASAGTSPTATATTGNQQITNAPVNPAVLSAILQILLDD